MTLIDKSSYSRPSGCKNIQNKKPTSCNNCASLSFNISDNLHDENDSHRHLYHGVNDDCSDPRQCRAAPPKCGEICNNTLI